MANRRIFPGGSSLFVTGDWEKVSVERFFGPQPLSATVSKSLGALTSSSASALDISGSASTTLGALTTTSAGGPAIKARTKGGTELVTNGTFDSGSGWTLGGNWSISGGVLNNTAGSPYTSAKQVIPGMVVGKNYILRFDLNHTSGILSVRSSDNGGIPGGFLEGSGSYDIEFTLGEDIASPAYGPTFFAWDPAYVGSIDNVSVKEAGITLDALTVDSEATIANIGLATANITLGTLTSSSAAGLAIHANTTKTLGAVTSTSSSAISIAATVNKTLAAVTSTSAGSSTIEGTVGKTLGALTVTTVGSLQISATTNKTFGALTSSSNGSLTITGSTSKTFGTLTSSSAANLNIIGSFSKTLGTLTTTSQSTLSIGGFGSITLAPLTGASQSSLAISGSSSGTFLAALLSSSASIIAITVVPAKRIATRSDSGTDINIGPVEVPRIEVSADIIDRSVAGPSVESRSVVANDNDRTTSITNTGSRSALGID